MTQHSLAHEGDADRQRSELAGQLHDSAVQQVIAARHRLDLARRIGATVDGSDLERHLTFVDGQLSDALRAMRQLMQGSPALRRGFEDVHHAILAAIDDVGDAFGVEVDVRCNGAAHRPTGAAPLVYRITLEALRNVGRHAATSHARIDAFVDGEISVEVSDDGRGFDEPVDVDDVHASPVGGFGLGNAAELAHRCGGRLALRSIPGRGTHVILQLPDDRRGA